MASYSPKRLIFIVSIHFPFHSGLQGFTIPAFKRAKAGWHPPVHCTGHIGAQPINLANLDFPICPLLHVFWTPPCRCHFHVIFIFFRPNIAHQLIESPCQKWAHFHSEKDTHTRDRAFATVHYFCALSCRVTLDTCSLKPTHPCAHLTHFLFLHMRLHHPSALSPHWGNLLRWSPGWELGWRTATHPPSPPHPVCRTLLMRWSNGSPCCVHRDTEDKSDGG